MIPMPTSAQLEHSEPLDTEARRAKAFEIITNLIKKNGLTPDEVNDVMNGLQESISRIREARMPFPFSQKETMAILREPMKESWLHPLANLSHKLIAKHAGVIEPFLVGGVDRESEGAPSKGVVCACFYATVRIKEDEIRVYDNFGMGGMCPEETEFLAAIHPTPDYIKALLPQLEAIVDQQSREGCKTYDVPKKVRLRFPEPELDGPGV